jgi:zinc protease
MLPGLMNTPSYKLQVKLVDVLYGGNPRVPVISFDIIDKASVNTLKNIHSQLFSGTKGLKMLIVGDFTPEEIQPLVEKYIGGIKKGGKALAWKDDGTDVVDGIVKCNDPVKMETPTTTAVLYYHAPMEYNELNHAALDAISYILDLRNTATLREEIGGTYGASSRTTLSDLPKAEATLQIAFQCKPELTETLVTTAQEIVENLAMEGPTEEEVSKAVLNLQKNVPENRLSNSYWLNLIKDYLMNPVEIDKAYEQAVNKLTAADIQAAAVKLLEAGNMIEFIQSPAE